MWNWYKLALNKATDPRLKQFAKKMLRDHKAAANSLQSAIRPLGIAPKPRLNPALQARLAEMKSKSGAAFNKAYRQDQKRAHAIAIAVLQDYRKKGANPKLKAWVSRTLPTIRQHQARINSM